MKKTPVVSSLGITWIFFSIGILSAVAFRFLIILHHLNPAMVRPVWYAGIIGYTLFFLFRYRISLKRKKAVNDYRLLDKVTNGEPFEGDTREAAKYLFNSISRSKEDINYLVIFILSIITVLIDLAIIYGRR